MWRTPVRDAGQAYDEAAPSCCSGRYVEPLQLGVRKTSLSPVIPTHGSTRTCPQALDGTLDGVGPSAPQSTYDASTPQLESGDQLHALTQRSRLRSRMAVRGRAQAAGSARSSGTHHLPQGRERPHLAGVVSHATSPRPASISPVGTSDPTTVAASRPTAPSLASSSASRPISPASGTFSHPSGGEQRVTALGPFLRPAGSARTLLPTGAGTRPPAR